MAIKNIIAKGIGFSPGSVKFIVTHGFDIATVIVTATITHVFKDENNTAFWADGINVIAIKSSTLSGASPTVLGNAAIAGGVGSVTIDLTEDVDVTLILDHLDVSAPANEQGITESLTPVTV